jgi:hypothetical protein
MTYDPDLQLERLVEQGLRFAFYPSCGFDARWLLREDVDVVALSDYSPTLMPPRRANGRRQFWERVRAQLGRVDVVAETVRTRVFRWRGKWGFLFFQDNNEVVRRLRAAGVRLHTFVGKTDGCCEGGNYECVNDAPFMRKVLDLVPDEVVYGTDHVREGMHLRHGEPDPLSVCRGYLECDHPRWLSPQYRHPRWLGTGYELEAPCRLFRSFEWECAPLLGPRGPTADFRWFRIRRLPRTVMEGTFGPVRLTFENDDLTTPLHEADGYLVTRSRWRALVAMGVSEARLDVIDDYWALSADSERYTRRLLETASSRGWTSIISMPYGKGRHEGILSAALAWEGASPLWLRIFHLHPGDFDDLAPRLRHVEVSAHPAPQASAP